MIVLSNSQVQDIAVGASVIFDVTTLKCGNSECHRRNTSSVKMTKKCCYEIEFHGNITNGTADRQLQLAIQLGGDTLPETIMDSVSVASNLYSNVGTKTVVCNNCGDYSRVTVTNTGALPLSIAAGSALVIKEA